MLFELIKDKELPLARQSARLSQRASTCLTIIHYDTRPKIDAPNANTEESKMGEGEGLKEDLGQIEKVRDKVVELDDYSLQMEQDLAQLKASNDKFETDRLSSLLESHYHQSQLGLLTSCLTAL